MDPLSVEATTPTPDEAGFELEAEIGAGAIATVYRARVADAGLAEGASLVAAKLLHPRHERDEVARRRFEREADLSRRLRHPNIVAVLGTTRLDDRAALIMELVEGPTLAEHLARVGPLPEDELVRLVTGIAGGLAFAHESGVIHRDLKPANILLTLDDPSVPKIADFGMARAASFASADRKAMTVLGTPPYMAPESLDPLAVDPRTDLYALGCMVYELATGEPPFGGPTPFAVLDAHRTADIPELPAGYSDGLRSLCKRLLAKAPGDRPQSASALVDALEALRTPEGAALATVGPTNPASVVADAGRCAACGSDVMTELRVCFRCGTVQVSLEPGPYTVTVVGPGRAAHKLGNEPRNRLLEWLRANAVVGLDPTPLEQSIPRLAFPLIVGLSQPSAMTVVASLERLEINAELGRGGRFTHPAVQRTGRKLAWRLMTILGSVFAVPTILNPLLGIFVTLPLVLMALPVAYIWGRTRAAKPMVLHASHQGRALPPKLGAMVERLYGLVPQIDLGRHREALRTVVHRSITLTRALPEAERASVDQEMAHAVNLASVACHRMNQLDHEMARQSFDPADPHHRAVMHERDLWSARLLDLTATLDALSARTSAAGARRSGRDEQEILDSLRATVESLEEVQRL